MWRPFFLVSSEGQDCRRRAMLTMARCSEPTTISPPTISKTSDMASLGSLPPRSRNIRSLMMSSVIVETSSQLPQPTMGKTLRRQRGQTGPLLRRTRFHPESAIHTRMCRPSTMEMDVAHTDRSKLASNVAGRTMSSSQEATDGFPVRHKIGNGNVPYEECVINLDICAPPLPDYA